MPAHPKTLAMIRAIAMREGTRKQLCMRFLVSENYMRVFTEEHIEDIREYAANPPQEHADEPSPAELADLWITNKTERLQRLQQVAEIAYADITTGGLSGAELATQTREFRSYLMLAANELGQLLNRGAGESGEGTFLSVEMNGVDMSDLK